MRAKKNTNYLGVILFVHENLLFHFNLLLSALLVVQFSLQANKFFGLFTDTILFRIILKLI